MPTREEWCVEEWERPTPETVTLRIEVDDDGETVGYVTVRDTPEARANVDRMAAAPTLLRERDEARAALEEARREREALLDLLSDVSRLWRVGGGPREEGDVRAAVRAALAKAGRGA